MSDPFPWLDRSHLPLHQRATLLFDSSIVWPPPPVWKHVRDPHQIANIRAEFAAACVLGEDRHLIPLADGYWPAEQRDAALAELRRLARSVRPDLAWPAEE